MASDFRALLSDLSPYQGVRCTVDLPACQLILSSEPESDQPEAVFDLPASRQVEDPVLQPSGQGICAMVASSGQKQSLVPWKMELEYGLIAGPEGCFVSRSDDHFEPWLLRSQMLIYPGSYTRRPAQGPFDLFVSDDQRLLAVVNRLEAHVLVFDLQTRRELARKTFEAFKGPKVINVAFSTQWQTLWLSGADSRELWRWDLDTGKTEAISGSWQFPTQVISQGNTLWLLDSQRKSRLHQLSLPELQPLNVLELEGSSYAHQTDTPADLMYFGPDGKWLAVLTQVNLPDPFTPKITVVDASSGQLLQQYQPSNRTWPALLTTTSPNEAYRKLLKQQQEINPEGGQQLSGVTQALLASFGLSLNSFSSTLLVLRAEKGPVVDLPGRTRELILDEIRRALQAEHGLSFVIPPRNVAEKEIVVHAERLAHMLRSHQEVECVIHRMLEHYTIGLKLNRQQLLGELKTMGLMSGGGADTSPTAAATAAPEQPVQALPEGWSAIADPLNTRLMQLNPELKPVWSLDTALFGVYRPGDLAWTPEGFIVLDTESAEVSCWSNLGKQEWTLSSKTNTWGRVRVAALGSQPLILGLDTERGTLEALSSGGQLHWSWSVLQEKPRVLDLCAADASSLWLLHDGGKVSRVKSDSGAVIENFEVPGFPAVLAASDQGELALFDGQVQALHVLTGDELQSHEISVSSTRYRIHQPLGLQWRSADELVLHDAYRLLVINARSGALLHECLLQDLQTKTGMPNLAPVGMFTSLAQRQNSMQGGSQQSLLDMLSRVSLFQQAPEDFIAELAGLIRTRVFNRGDEIVRKGDEGKEMFLIRQGEVEVMGARMTDVVASMGPGDIFGEIALMLGQKRNATVRAAGYCEVFCLGQSELDALLPYYPGVRDRLLQLAQERQLQEQLRSEQEQERLRSRIEALSAQRKSSTPALRPNLQRMAAAAVDPASLSPLEIWVRHQSGGQLALVSREGTVLKVLGDHQLLLQPVRVLDTQHGLWVLDAGQNQLLLLDSQTLERRNAMTQWSETQLEQPRDMAETLSGSLWIANTGKGELLHISAQGQLLDRLSHGRAPSAVSALDNGHLLVTDMRQHTVSEITASGETVWSYGTPRKFGRDENLLFSPEYATRLPNGHTLIADTGNSRVIEVDSKGRIVWSLLSGTGLRMTRPTRAERLPDGHILVEHSNRSQWLEVNRELIPAWRYAVPVEAFEESIQSE